MSQKKNPFSYRLGMDHFYKCSDEVLFGLGKMYAAGGEFTDNIDKMGGDGTAEFTYQAINNYCKG